MARFRFAAFEVNEARFELSRAGRRVPIQAKPLELLLYLLRRPGDAVAKAELLGALWPEETVTEYSLTRAVRAARRALGEGAGDEGVIRTVRGRGYAIGVPVEREDDARSPPVPSGGGREHRLAAILSVDAVEYSRRLAHDEAGTVEALQSDRQRMGELVARHGGRVVDAVGDNLLALFSSAVDAVRCGVAIQEELGAHAGSLRYRAGIHLGDVLLDGDRMVGHAVNVAARLEGLAEPGGICVSEVVADQTRGRLPVAFRDGGERTLKNIARPVRIHHVSLERPPEDPDVYLPSAPSGEPLRTPHTDRPETLYARSGELHIAYQVTGNGPVDLLFIPGMASHLEFQWEEGSQAHLFRKLAGFSRLIRFDKRGGGLSDPVASMPTIEERMDDVRAVLDSVGSTRAVILGLSEGGPLGAVFAASFPERVSALILWNSFATLVRREPDHPTGYPASESAAIVARLEEAWGNGLLAPLFVPSAAEDPAFREWWARFERTALSPGAMAHTMRMNFEIDVRDVLPVIRVPTLVMHTAGDRTVPAGCGRYVAARVPGARYVELPGEDHFDWGNPAVPAEIERFIGERRSSVEVSRVLGTVLFADLAASEALAKLDGSRSWHAELERAREIARSAVERFRGRFVDTADEGVFGVFDGPGRAIACARAIVDQCRPLGIDVRAGIHSGEVEVAPDRIVGAAVDIGARVSGLADPGQVLVTRTVVDLSAGSGTDFRERTRPLEGIPDPRQVFEVAGGR